ncbi:hypothetical protein J19TS1_38500 [Heyndrickxia oleronia]|nr:hypothetical protein J19TS1_38500 [Heyndrickxia oleronia]
MGLKFKKFPDVVAPNFFTPIFQNNMQSTVETTPVYNIEEINVPLIEVTVKSTKLNGRRTRSPNTPE